MSLPQKPMSVLQRFAGCIHNPAPDAVLQRAVDWKAEEVRVMNGLSGCSGRDCVGQVVPLGQFEKVPGPEYIGWRGGISAGFDADWWLSLDFFVAFEFRATDVGSVMDFDEIQAKVDKFRIRWAELQRRGGMFVLALSCVLTVVHSCSRSCSSCICHSYQPWRGQAA